MQSSRSIAFVAASNNIDKGLDANLDIEEQ
jgi:hypothetical protein